MTLYVYPKMELQGIQSLILFLDSPVGKEHEFIRGVTLTMEVPHSELSSVSTIVGFALF